MTTTASEVLTRALVSLAAAGLRPHCSDRGTSELWLSDHPGERAEAARLCAGCPAFALCGAAGRVRLVSVRASFDRPNA